MPKMKALVTYPGKAGTIEIIEVERPRVSAGEVLIAMRDVGIDGTDVGVIEGAHGGSAPSGSDYMIITDQGGQDDARDRYRLHQRP